MPPPQGPRRPTRSGAGVPALDHDAAHPGERAACFLFFVSGAAGLIFEIVWFNRSGLVFGNSVWVASLVLSSFMAGLAIGNALAGYRASRIERPWRTYALLEAVVGISGLAVTYGLSELIGVVAALTRMAEGTPWLVTVLRLAIAFVFLVVPTTAMGATLPVLIGAASRGRTGFGRVLGRLYGWNTMGAVTGALAAELLLIRYVGVTGSAWAAALLNLGVASVAWWMSQGEPRRSVEVAAPHARGSAEARLLACAFLAGGTLLALEVVWFRFLSLFVVASTLAVSVMLAVVLSAIGLGGIAAAAWLKRRAEAVSALPAAAAGAAALTSLSYALFGFLTAGPWAADWSRIFWFACALTLPTSLLSGVMFTLIGAALKRHVADDARAAAWLTLANTCGGMVGPLVAGFLLLPVIGMERSFFVLSLAYVVLGLLAVRDTITGLGTMAARAALATGAAAAVVLIAFPFGSMASAYFSRAVQTYSADGSRIVATREGPSETVILLEKAWMGTPLSHRLVTNSFSMSGTQLTGKRYMRYFAYWPMLLHQAPLRRALVVCYGVGVTAGAVADIKSLESIDVVEISRDIVAMSDVIYPAEDAPLRDPRVRMHFEDGRNFLQTTSDRFDLITGEPPPPLTPGTVNLYTREYFQLAHDRLADKGMFTYWLPVARRGEYDVKAIIRAFCDVFEDCSMWNGTPFDWMLVGTRGADERATEAQFEQAWSDPGISGRLREIGFEVPEEIGATFLGDARFLSVLTDGTAPLTDNFPQRLRPMPARLSQVDSPAGVDREQRDFIAGVIDPVRAREAFLRSPLIRTLWPERLIDASLPFFEYQRSINRIMFEGASPLRRIDELHALLTGTSLRELPLWALGSDDAQQEIAARSDDGSYMVPYVRGVTKLAAREYAAAAEELAQAERRGLRPATSRPLMVYALALAGDLDTARRLADGDMPSDPDRRYFWTWLGARFNVGPGAPQPDASAAPGHADPAHPHI